ncbi:MAG: hypothetical protein WKF85_12585 [Chitinophagaceae bacterium]
MNKIRSLIISIRKQYPQYSPEQLFQSVLKEIIKNGFYSNKECEIIKEEIWERLMNSNEAFKVA